VLLPVRKRVKVLAKDSPHTKLSAAGHIKRLGSSQIFHIKMMHRPGLKVCVLFSARDLTNT